MPRVASAVCYASFPHRVVWHVLHALHGLAAQRLLRQQCWPLQAVSGLDLDATRDIRVSFGDITVAANTTTDISTGPRAS